MDPRELLALNRRHTLFTWKAQAGLQPPLVVAAERCHFVLADGTRVLDLASGVFNANAGLRHPAIVEAIADQAQQMPVAAPYMATPIRGEAARSLSEITPAGLDRFVFCVSGAEAAEHALKIARMVTGREKILARTRSYHGATLLALAATGDARREPFVPWLFPITRLQDPYCYRCPWNTTPDRCTRPCAEELEAVCEREDPNTIAALIVEPIAGTNGGFVPPIEWLQRAREVCDRYGIVLIADEVLTGFGRTGRWFGVEHFGVTPDLMTLGKAITSGHAPLAAVAMNERIARHFDHHPLTTGTTHTAHPIALAAARATVDVMQREQLVERAAALQAPLRRRLMRLQANCEIVGDVRVIGLYAVLELVTDRSTRAAMPAAQLTQIAARLEQQAQIHVLTRENFLFVAPPICIAEEQLLGAIDSLETQLGTSKSFPLT
jgi:taurine--2-oxoglutarate transaminase